MVLDAGYPTTAPMIVASIAKLGLDIKDVKILLESDRRPDHAGGLAALQQASGAKLWASAASAALIAAGGDDPDVAVPLRILLQIGLFGYPPARVDRRFNDGDTIRLGPIALTAHVTGGSTRGCTSWSFAVREGDRVLNVVSAWYRKFVASRSATNPVDACIDPAAIAPSWTRPRRNSAPASFTSYM